MTNYITDHLLQMRAIRIDNDPQGDLKPYNHFAFTSNAASIEPGRFIDDAAVCVKDNHKLACIPDQTGKTAAQVRAALNLSVK